MTVSAPLIIVGYIMFLTAKDPQVRYGEYLRSLSSVPSDAEQPWFSGATFLIAAGAFSFGALCNAWAAVNSELPFADLERTWADNVPVPATSDSMRAGAIGTVVMFGNLGGLVATWTVRLTRLVCRRAPLLTRL